MEILGDFTTSVTKALSEIDPDYMSYDSLVVCGSHTPHDTEITIQKIRDYRNMGKPALLICMGYQLGCIQYYRDNGIPDATSEEFGQGTFVVKKRPELKVGLHDGESWWSYYEADDYPIPDNWVAVPYHPEYGSSIGKPHKDLIRFLQLVINYEANKRFDKTMAM